MATTFEQSGSTLIVKPEGRIDTKTSPILEKDIRAHFDSAEDIITQKTIECQKWHSQSH